MKPIIAIPMGDPAGIGPEIVVKALADPEITNCAACLVVGDGAVLEQAMTFPNMPKLNIHCVESPQEGNYDPGILNVIDLKMIQMDAFHLGEVSGECGKAAYAYIEKSAQLCLSGQAEIGRAHV